MIFGKNRKKKPVENPGYAVYDQTPLAFSTDPSFKDYTFVYFVQRVPVDTTLVGYDFTQTVFGFSIGVALSEFDGIVDGTEEDGFVITFSR